MKALTCEAICIEPLPSRKVITTWALSKAIPKGNKYNRAEIYNNENKAYQF
jgi:hypothetical protein